MIVRRLAFTFVAALLAACAGSGAWQQTGGTSVFATDGSRLIWREEGQLSLATIAAREDGTLITRHHGRIERVTIHGDRAQVQSATYTHIAQRPADLALVPLKLPAPRELSAERVAAIQKQLASWLADDQAARKDPKRKYTKPDLIPLLKDAGWIDVHRFGMKASYNAVILAKHSEDLALLVTIMPLIESDFRGSGEDAQAFAITFDELQILLGRQQRYGSQVCDNAGKEPFVCSLEDPAHVDERRAAIGLPPLAEYLSMVSQFLYNKQPVRVPAANELQ